MVLFAAPAVLLSSILAAVVLAGAAGALWLFVFGDDPWPPVANVLLGVVFVVCFALVLTALLSVAYAVGKRQESRGTLNKSHVVLSVVATLALAAVIVLQLVGTTFVGRTSDSITCADFCRGEGLAGSGTSPERSGDRTCSCYDAQGREVRRMPVSQLPSGR
jgi:hypothetical protein